MPTKKTVPKKRTQKKQVVKAAKPQKADFIKPVISAVIILVVVAAIAATYSVIRTAQLKKQANSSQFLTLQDKEKNKTYQIPINPASVALSTTQQATNISVTTSTSPVAISTTAKKSYKELLKPVASKETIPRIDLDEAKYLYKSGKAVFIDARALTEYQEAHIAGAIPIPAGSAATDIPKFANVLKNKVLVSYCHGVGCHLSDKTAYALYDAGYRKVCIFFGGWPQWTQANLPITKKGDSK